MWTRKAKFRKAMSLIPSALIFNLCLAACAAFPMEISEEDELSPPEVICNRLPATLPSPQSASDGDRSEQLLVPSSYLELESAGCRVCVEAGAVVHITHKDGITYVRNLLDKKHDSVRVIVERRCQILQQGQELMIGCHPNCLIQDASQDMIERRHGQIFKLADERAVMRSEFELASFLRDSRLYSRLKNSANRNEQRLADRLMKAAVCQLAVRFGKRKNCVEHR